MAGLRRFDFDSGPETPNLPTAPTPSVDDDLVTKGFADGEYARRSSFLDKQATVAALKAVTSAVYADNQLVFVDETLAIYRFDAAEATAGDDINFITPDDITEPAAGRWVKLAPSAGGGGAGLAWYLPDTGAAVRSVDADGVESFDFHDAGGQALFVQIPVPSSYSPGAQIQLTNSKYSIPVTSGNIKFQTQTKLLRSGTTVQGSLGNAHNSTNSELTADAVANEINDIGNMQLTDGSGQIDGVPVAVGDTLLVKLIRDTGNETSSAADDAKFLPGTVEPDFG